VTARWRRRRLAAALGAWLLGTSAWAQTPDELYGAAVKAIAEGDLRRAIELLDAVRAQDEEHAGALLDLADVYCRLGDKFRAEEQLAILEAHFELPAPIQAQVARLRAARCEAPQRTRWALGALAGYETNVNQGTAIHHLLLPGETGPLELTLTDDFRPTSSPMAGLRGYVEHALETGDSVYGTFAARHYPSASDFDLVRVGGGYGHGVRLGGWRGTLEVSGEAQTLGGTLYYTAGALQTRWTAPTPWDGGPELGLEAGTALLHYPSRDDFDALETTLLVPASWRLGERASLRVSGGWVYDAAWRQRPGGDRDGPLVGVEATLALSDAWTGYAGWQRRVLRSSGAYAAPLLPMRRRQVQDFGVAALERRLGAHTLLRTEYRYVGNDDTVPLYTFGSHALTLYWVRESR
jgi:hypothetical protein